MTSFCPMIGYYQPRESLKPLGMVRWSLLLLILLLQTRNALAFTSQQSSSTHHSSYSLLQLHAQKLSDLPRGISPFEKGDYNPQDLRSQFWKAAGRALDQVRRDNASGKRTPQQKRLLEIEFPPLLFKGKTQFDDFDNVQELDLNRDWCIEWLPMLKNSNSDNAVVWLILPDVKECELAKQEWKGSRYRDAAQFTTIEAVTRHYASTTTATTSATPTTTSATQTADYKKPWGATFASGMSNLFTGGGDLLGDSGALDQLEGSPDIHLICQPGNGGPVEDWVNCEILHNNGGDQVTTVIINGALDKVRDGYYPGIFFPALAATVDRFYKKFESIFYLRPLSDKGCYGWVYRVYPEPWQVILQTKTVVKDKVVIENTVVYTSDTRPSFALALEKMVQEATSRQQS